MTLNLNQITMIVMMRRIASLLLQKGLHSTPTTRETQTRLCSQLRKCKSLLNSYPFLRRCCMCGVMMPPNQSSTCINCLKTQVDITDGITKAGIIHQCRECQRYLRPPWVHCELESKELLTLCLKNVKGLKRVKLIDAGFVYTEPHSKRLKVKISIQSEVLNGTLLQ